MKIICRSDILIMAKENRRQESDSGFRNINKLVNIDCSIYKVQYRFTQPGQPSGNTSEISRCSCG